MKNLKLTTAVFLMIMSFGAIAQTQDDKKIMEDAQEAKKTLLSSTPDLAGFFTKSAGYALFPNVGKGGFIVGAASGNGVVYENEVALGMADLKKLNIGLQAGGQAIIEVIFFETHTDLDRFKEGEFQFAAEASAVALKSGKAVNAKYTDGVAVFALPKAGLMADASVGGQKFTFKPF